MPGCKDVSSVQRAGALPPGKEGFCDRLGAGHCYWGNCLASVEAALAPGCLSPIGQEEGRRRTEFLVEERSQLPGKLYIRTVLTMASIVLGLGCWDELILPLDSAR